MGEKEGDDKKKSEGGAKGDGGATTVVLKLDMHCEGCAKKVKRSIKNFDGVESVKTDFESNKLTVIGKVDPSKIKERVEEKIKKKVELISPLPNKAAKEGEKKKSDDNKKPDEKKSDGKSNDKSEDKKEKPKAKEPQVSVATLKTRVHCEGCAQKIRRIVGKYEGVQDVNVDLSKDVITIKGTMNMKDLLPYLNVKLKRSVELAPAKKDEGAGGDKKGKEGSAEKPKEANAEKPKDGGSGKKEGGGDKKDGGGVERKDGAKSVEGGPSLSQNTTTIEVNRMEYGGYNPYGYGYGYNHTYDPRQQVGYNNQVVEYWHAPENSHPPQMFSDENPNACSVM